MTDKNSLRIVDAGDGSGDGMLGLSQEYLDQFGWKIGDALLVRIPVGEPRTLVLIRATDNTEPTQPNSC